MLFSARKSREEQENPRKVQLFSNLFIRDHGCAPISPIQELRDANLEFHQLLWLVQARDNFDFDNVKKLGPQGWSMDRVQRGGPWTWGPRFVYVQTYRTSSSIEIKATETWKKLLHTHEYCLTLKSQALFSQRDGDWGLHGMFMPGMVKKNRERETEVMLGMLGMLVNQA